MGFGKAQKQRRNFDRKNAARIKECADTLSAIESMDDDRMYGVSYKGRSMLNGMMFPGAFWKSLYNQTA